MVKAFKVWIQQNYSIYILNEGKHFFICTFILYLSNQICWPSWKDFKSTGYRRTYTVQHITVHRWTYTVWHHHSQTDVHSTTYHSSHWTERPSRISITYFMDFQVKERMEKLQRKPSWNLNFCFMTTKHFVYTMYFFCKWKTGYNYLSLANGKTTWFQQQWNKCWTCIITNDIHKQFFNV